MLYKPSSLVVTVRSSPVSVLLTLTVALGTSAPVGSLTVPRRVPETVCAVSSATHSPAIKRRETTIFNVKVVVFFIIFRLFWNVIDVPELPVNHKNYLRFRSFIQIFVIDTHGQNPREKGNP